MKRWQPAYARLVSSVVKGVALGILIVLGIAAFVLTPGGGPQPANQEPTNQQTLEPIKPLTTADPVPMAGDRGPAIARGPSLRDVQDFYLAILLEDSGNQEALAALAVVRRQMAGGDPSVLQAQTRAYLEAISRGIESDERYSIRAMRVLVRVGALAISQIEAEQRAYRAAQPAALPAPAVEPSRSLAKPSPPSVVAQAPPPSAVGQAPAPSIAPKRRIGARPLVLRSAPTISAQPVAEVHRERLARIAKAAARQAPPAPLFRVLSQPMRVAVADRRAAALTARGFRPVVRPLPGGMAHLQFGVFVSRHNADSLAARIRSHGLAVIVGTDGAALVTRASVAPQTAATAPAMRRSTDFETLMREGHALYGAGWYGPAVSRFRTASVVAPNSPRAQLWLGRAAVKALRLSEAQRALQRVIHLAPTSDAAREAQTILARLD